MSNSLSRSSVVRHEPEMVITPLHLLVLLSLALGAAIWGATLILGGQQFQLQRYLAVLGFYGVSSAVFVVTRIRRGKLHLFELPVFMTVMFFLQLGLLPLRNFIDPEQLDKNLSANGEELVRALFYFTVGMAAFWMGCEFARRRKAEQVPQELGKLGPIPDSRRTGVLLFSVALYALAFVTKFYLLKNQLYSYVGSVDKYYGNLASMQVLNVISQLGTFALIVVTIERYRNRSDPVWKFLFLVILSCEILWCLISGMKGLVMQNFVVVAIVSSFVQRRVNLRWLIVPLLILICLIPFFGAYRSLARGGGLQVTSIEDAARGAHVALQDAIGDDTNPGDLWRAGLSHLVSRLDLLTSVAQVLALGPRARMLEGDERWWMLPLYPFVPRLLWSSKPILDKGGRLSLALSGPNSTSTSTSTAITYPGDLYLQ